MANKKVLQKQVIILWDALNAISVGSDVNVKHVARKAMDDSVKLIIDDEILKITTEIEEYVRIVSVTMKNRSLNNLSHGK